MIGALALGALWIVGLHWWSLLLVAAFVAVGFAAVARAEQLEKGSRLAARSASVSRTSRAGRPARTGQLSFGCAFFLRGPICSPSSWPMSTPFSKCTQ